MSFSDKFLAHFTAEERESELVQICAAEGNQTENDLLQEFNKQLLQQTELLAFPEGRIRSWLSALQRDIPNVTSASGTLTVKYLKGDNLLVLPAGLQLDTSEGSVYTQVSTVTLSPGETGTVTIVQGKSSVSSGTYDELISLPAENIDLNRLVLTLDNRNIKKCSLHDGYVIPYDGYHAFQHDGVLYLKVYPGPNTPIPEGLTYQVEMWQSEGTKGNIPSNAVIGYTTPIADTKGFEVELEFRNPVITNGADLPTRVDLINQLRLTLLKTASVSSIPEYTAWFKNQTEVSDCIVEGDFERTRKGLATALQITGAVYVAALGPDGNAISKETQVILEDKIANTKDIGLIQWVNPTKVDCFFQVKYQGSNNDVAFLSKVRESINNLFDLQYLNSIGATKFADLDMEDFRSLVGTEYGPVGLEVTPYHYVKDEILGDAWRSPDNKIFPDLSGFGFYRFYNEDGKLVLTAKHYVNPDIINIQVTQVDPELAPEFQEGDLIGYFTANQAQINRVPAPNVEAYWEVVNPGVMTLGEQYAYRNLIGYEVLKVTA